MIFIFSSVHISAKLRKHRHPHMLPFTRISSLCVCVRACVYMQGGRSWPKFINFLWTNEAPCAFFLLTNGTDREVGGGCCLATAGRISDHVGPIVLSLLPERRYMLYVVRNISVRVRHKVANSISVRLKPMVPHPPGSIFNWLPSFHYESTRTYKWSNLVGLKQVELDFPLVCFAVFSISCTGLRA